MVDGIQIVYVSQIDYVPQIFSAPSSLALSHLQRPQLVGRCRIIGSWQLVYAPYVHPDDAYDVR